MDIINYFIGPYESYSTIFIVLESIAVIFGILSVWFSKKENILVFPTGLISTTIFVYLLFQWQLLGDMIINLYYTIMSIYGWYIWTRINDKDELTPITKMHKKDIIKTSSIFIISIISVLFIYRYKAFINSGFEMNQLNQIHQFIQIDYIDAFTTGTAFVGMWLMAKKKLEHWYFWIATNFVSIPVYFIFKNHGITGLQYIIFLIVAILGLLEWSKKYNQIKTD